MNINMNMNLNLMYLSSMFKCKTELESFNWNFYTVFTSGKKILFIKGEGECTDKGENMGKGENTGKGIRMRDRLEGVSWISSFVMMKWGNQEDGQRGVDLTGCCWSNIEHLFAVNITVTSSQQILS